MNNLPITKRLFESIYKDKEILKFTTPKNKYYLEYYYRNFINDKGFYFTDSYKINSIIGYRDFTLDQGREYTASINFTKRSVPLYEGINPTSINLSKQEVLKEVEINLNEFFSEQIEPLIDFSLIEFLQEEKVDLFIFNNIILEFNKVNDTFIKLYKTVGKKRYRKYTSGNNSQTFKILKRVQKVDRVFYKSYINSYINSKVLNFY